jgi:psp operon transcriptional activator
MNPDLPPLLGEAPAFRAALAQVSQLAGLDRPVLVVGERGTGKELVAARITFLSPRWDKPFVKLNCAALAESLLDSELFGHEAGAFTGATRRRLSRFEIADGGTLFLDEIATASLAVQEKILRVIEYGSFERVGGNEVHHVDVRVIAATNVDLPALAESGDFRSDLLDRLAFDVVTIPPLRQRPEDIPLLAEHFARGMTRELGREVFQGFTAAALARLSGYHWPGNVRELKNAVERSLYRWPRPEAPVDDIVFDAFQSPHRPLPYAPSQAGEGRVGVAASAPSVSAPPPSPPVTAPPPSPSGSTDPGDFLGRVAVYERKLLAEALSANHFNQRRTALALGLSYDQLRHHLKKHALIGRG